MADTCNHIKMKEMIQFIHKTYRESLPGEMVLCDNSIYWPGKR